MQLSAHFELSEFLRSQAAARQGVELNPPAWAVDNLKRLCDTVLEPLRDYIGRAVAISSGYRPPWLNTLIGGAPESAHLFGRAADIYVPGMAPAELAGYIKLHALKVDKCILEFNAWVHIQVSDSPSITPRRLYLTALHSENGTVYKSGLLG